MSENWLSMPIIRLIISSCNSFETNNSKADLSINTLRPNLLFQPVFLLSLYVYSRQTLGELVVCVLLCAYF